MSLVSMTGFGRAEEVGTALQIAVEAKTVNHRYLDLVWKLPPVYQSLEQGLTRIAREYIQRGRVEISVMRRQTLLAEGEVVFHRPIFEGYVNAARDAVRSVKGEDEELVDQLIVALLQRREVLELVPREAPAEDERRQVEQALRRALEQAIEGRWAEGQALERHILSQLSLVGEGLESISQLSEQSVELYQERLSARVKKLLGEAPVDPIRLAQEVALFAERTDISEEVARLQSHVAQFRSTIAEPAAGRKLDFLLQEMGREVNTIGSKSQSSQIGTLVISLKGAIEKMREQVQNVE